MSTHVRSLPVSNKALYRTAAIAGSAILWTGIGYLALTYVPKMEKMVFDDGPTIKVLPKDKPIPPPPPIPDEKPKIVKNQKMENVVPPKPDAITIRQPPTKTANPLPSEFSAGPVAEGPVTFADPGPIAGDTMVDEPIVAPPLPILPPEAPPVEPPKPQLVVNPVRISGTNPTFPMRALERGISGEVTLSFTVSSSGKVENINVSQEEPRGYGFARAAREAIETWTFQPQTIDGVAVAYPARYTISFKLED